MHHFNHPGFRSLLIVEISSEHLESRDFLYIFLVKMSELPAKFLYRCLGIFDSENSGHKLSSYWFLLKEKNRSFEDFPYEF